MQSPLSLAAFTATLVTALAAQAQVAPSQPAPIQAARSKPTVAPKLARTLKGARDHQRLSRPTWLNRGPGAPVGPLTATEVERNDSIGFADALGAQPDYDGDIAVAGDIDWVRCDVTALGTVTFDVAQAGANPIADATLTVRDAAGQFVAFNDDRPASLMPLVSVALPAGTYYAGVQGFGGSTTGTYKLTVTNTPTNFATINVGGTNSGTVPAGGEVAFQLLLPTASTVHLNITANGGMDMYCVLVRQTGAVHRFVDDGMTGTTDPSLDTHLPAGAYLVVFGDFLGTGGAFSFATSGVASPVPTLACGGSVTGSVAGAEGQAMYSMVLPSTSLVTLTPSPNGAPAMSDSWVTLYDRDLNTIAYNDDNNNSLFSLLSSPLPAGQYYVGVEAYSNGSEGGFQLALTCATATTNVGRFGRNSGSLVGGDTAAFVIDTGTATPVEMIVPTPPVLFPMSAVLDGSGRCLAYSDFADFDLIGARAGVGEHWFLVRDYFNQAGTFDADVQGSLFFQAPTKGALTMQDKAGQVQFVFAAALPLFPGFPVPAPFTGNLLMTPPLVSLPAITIPANGVTTYPATYPAGNYFVQALSVSLSPLGGPMTNLAK